MKFGFFMMPAHSHNENPTLAFERDLQLIEYAESLGFDEFWFLEHGSYRVPNASFPAIGGPMSPSARRAAGS